jgi:hypothetical protein
MAIVMLRMSKWTTALESIRDCWFLLLLRIIVGRQFVSRIQNSATRQQLKRCIATDWRYYLIFLPILVLVVTSVFAVFLPTGHLLLGAISHLWYLLLLGLLLNGLFSFLLVIVLGGIAMRMIMGKEIRRQLNRIAGPICIQCGYDLRGCADQRCPECGEMVEIITVDRDYRSSVLLERVSMVLTLLAVGLGAICGAIFGWMLAVSLEIVRVPVG